MSNVINLDDFRKKTDEEDPDALYSLGEEGRSALEEIVVPHRDVDDLTEEEVELITLLALDTQETNLEKVENIVDWAHKTIVAYGLLSLLLDKKIGCYWSDDYSEPVFVARKESE